ncbi:hypothetical protein JRQ81_006243 [Phrynocephalus forsythii]|uniref:Centrosomal protein of 89 kDa n=1 Tax=Phrynocephalus forsythii TaxID=171643 RepID=A0A9Q1AUM6_9SAUR|nr:hypothetical protein JRQ81_006243 [Phrynocephalus forsythii]
MAFYFRRGRKGPFKHIAHGLIPAATIAPKPAVPRTPPPRSPNPSPERPRSALAAAILVTTLTGRTVAIPQPRQRSLSESDASCLQDRESCIQPYATITELRTGPNWKSDGDDERIAVRSFEVSDSCCDDEDMETYPSDTEKEPVPIYQVIGKEESEALYAVPHKVKREQLQVSSSVGGEEDEPSAHEPSCLIHPDVQVEELEHSEMNFKVESKSAETPLNGKPPPSLVDVLFHRKQGEMFKKLKEENWHLSNTCQTLSSQLEETKQQMKELQLKILEKENGQCKETVQKSQNDEEHAELISLRKQAQELVDENDSLKMTIHHLNAELSRYQTKYRPLSPNEGAKFGSLPMKKPTPPWLLDMKYLSPLMLAYEDRMREKEELILAHEEDMKMFKAQVEEIVKENEELHKQLSRNSSVTTKEWQQLQSQAKLVLEENTVLMEQLKIQQAKAKDSLNQHVQEISRLTNQLTVLEAKKRSQEEELREYQKQLDELRSAYKELKASVQDCITVEEHVTLINKIQSQLREERDKREKEVQELMEKLASLQAEKKGLLIEKNDLAAFNKVFEHELEMAQKMKRRLQKKTGLLKQQLEEAKDKETETYKYLAELITVAENVTQQRDQLFNLASCLEKEKDGVLSQIIEGNVRLGRLEEKVKVYRKDAAGKLGDVSLKMTEQEKEFAGKIAQYQREMKHLQRLLQEKQETLDEVLQQKREMESELEIIWESTTKENRRMKELLHKSLEKTNAQSPARAYLADVPQKDLLDGFGFSYCEVELSPPAKIQSQQEPVH